MKKSKPSKKINILCSSCKKKITEMEANASIRNIGEFYCLKCVKKLKNGN